MMGLNHVCTYYLSSWCTLGLSNIFRYFVLVLVNVGFVFVADRHFVSEEDRHFVFVASAPFVVVGPHALSVQEV